MSTNPITISKADETPKDDLDPRIQEELEKLNHFTDEINRLEIELDEANSTFRLLMNDSTRKLKLLARKLGGCIERARPYYEALELSKQAQQECQRAAVKFQRANEIHQAAKETVALAETRFLSKQHEWEFDSAWQEMLNNAIMKVTDAEHQKAESGREHQKKTKLFHATEQKVQVLEARCHRHITKSRPYFEEKLRCDSQLTAQRERVLHLRTAISKAKRNYSLSLRRLEDISEEIHLKRKRNMQQKSRSVSPCGERQPGVGAELTPSLDEGSSQEIIPVSEESNLNTKMLMANPCSSARRNFYSGTRSPSLDLDYDLDQFDTRSVGGGSSIAASSTAVSDTEDDLEDLNNLQDLEELKQKVRELATRPVIESDCSQRPTDRKHWEEQLNVAVQKLDQVLQLQENDENSQSCNSSSPNLELE